MQVFKFGGASISSAERIRNFARIVESHAIENLVIVVSAMGGVTDMLADLVVKAHRMESYEELLQRILLLHRDVIKALDIDYFESYQILEKSLKQHLEEINQLSELIATDRILPYGELMSTTILSAYLNKLNIKTKWLDARELIRTDQYYGEANVDWVVTEYQIQTKIKSNLQDVIITQGFIGSDVDGNSTTLGRNGSDFTGAILAYCLNAKNLIVWKDVPGILNADPSVLKETSLFESLSYREATEMAYYGAEVIHPKTLKPLAQKNIQLSVKSFLNEASSGTTISNRHSPKSIPCFVFKGNQLLVTAEVKDHSFMEEKKLGMILQVLDLLNIKINLMQNSALTFSFCIDNKPFKAKRIMELLNRDFILSFDDKLSLATIKNYNHHSFNLLPWNRTVIMEQKTTHNYHVVYR